jgi:inner membrane protein
MPSPIGHLIAGAAIGKAVTPQQPAVIVACAILATASDLDLMLPQTHRTWTHSLVAVAFVTILAIAVTGKVKRFGDRPGDRPGDSPRDCPRTRSLVVAALVLAFTSHLLLDWLAADPTPPHGIQLFWPFSSDWYISGLNIFRGTARRNLLTARTTWINTTAIAQELAILGPIVWVTWRLRR